MYGSDIEKPGRRRSKLFAAVRIGLAWMAGLGIPLALLVYATNLPQKLYSQSIRNIYFDCVAMSDQPYVYKAKPGPCRLDNIEYRTTLTHDAQGFRNKDTTAPADIAFLGDSHTHGQGVDDDQTFAALLAQRGWRTKNLGMGSYATLRELEAYRAYGGRETTVVLQYCDNDYPENVRSLTADRAQFAADVAERWLKIAEQYREQKKAGLVVPLVNFAQLLTRFSFESRSSFRASVNKRNIEAEADIFARILKSYEPLLQGKQLILFESSGWGLNHPRFKSAFETAIKTHSPGLKVGVLDSTSFLRDGDYYFLDDHLNPSGHRRIAETLVATIAAKR